MATNRMERVLKKELRNRDLRLVWSPKPGHMKRDELVVFGAEQKVGCKAKKQLSMASPMPVVNEYHEAFLRSLELAGVPRNCLHSTYVHVGRGKIWPTFIARITQESFRVIKER